MPLLLYVAVFASNSPAALQLLVRDTLRIPDVAVVSLLLGILLLYAEFNRPGTYWLGAAGMLGATLGCWELARHALCWPAGCAIAAGMALTLLAIFTAWPAVSGILGFESLALGLVFLIRGPGGVAPWLAHAVALVWCGVTFGLGRIALRARRNKRIRHDTGSLRPAPDPPGVNC